MMLVMMDFGVKSKAGFFTVTESGAHLLCPNPRTSDEGRSSMQISAPSCISKSIVVKGAAT